MNIIQVLPRFRQAQAAMRLMAERETWDSQRLRAYQLERLNEIWSHATSYVPYYRELCSELGLPKEFRNIEQFTSCVPIVDKTAVKNAPRRFLSEKPRPGRWHYTGGSTGTPMAVYWEKQSYLEVLRSKYRFHELWDVGVFDRTVFLWGHSASFAPGWRGRVARFRRPVEDRLRNRLRLSAYSLTPRDLDHYLEQLSAFRPALFYGYSSAVLLLARHAVGSGRFPGSLKVVVYTSEALPMELVPMIEAGLGAVAGPGECERRGELRRLLTEASRRAVARIASIERLARHAGELAAMEYDFLFDRARHLLAIGYNVSERRRDA
ncbi:MAG: hypothetical protein LAQ30_31620, partial [Acidobacteriia bacterium]|nr:hypothetical protein [Terriglobia bacterium]